MRYDNDTIVSKAFSLSSSGINQVRIPMLENRKVKNISGYIYLNPEKEMSTTLKMMIVKNIQLIKMRKKEEPNTILKKDSVGVPKQQTPIDTTLKTKEI